MLFRSRYFTFHGFQPTDRLVDFYRRAYLLVQTSRHEACGIAVLEAASCGVPIVGTAVGHVADWSPVRAVAVHERDPHRLASEVARLLDDSALRARLAAGAREWTVAHDADWTAREFERVYHEITAS